MSPRSTRAALEALSAPLLRRVAATGGALGAGGALLALGAGAWLVRLGVVRTLWWVPAAWCLAFAAMIAAAAMWRRRSRSLRVPELARRLESEGAWRLGSLTGLLSAPASGVSPELHAAAEATRAADVAARGPGALLALASSIRRDNRRGAAVLFVGTLGLLGAGPGSAPVRMLWHPAKALRLALGAVQIDASSRAVNRGDSVSITIRAPGRQGVTLWRRAPGESWRGDELPLDAAGEARLSSGPLTADLFVRATGGGRGSDTLRIEVRVPAFLGSLSVTAQYPSYLAMEDEVLTVGPDTLLLPEGTRLLLEGEATAPLGSARLTGPNEATALAIEGERFSGRAAPIASGAYRLTVETRTGTPLAGDDATLFLRMTPDSAPAVAIPVPGADTLAPVGMTVPLVIDARDDHGLSSVVIVSRRISRLGLEDPERREAVPLPEGNPGRLLAPFLLDLEGRSLLPGDTVRYYALATDNAPRARTGRSPEYILRLPTLAEVRAAERAATASVGEQLDSLAASSKQLQRQTEDLSREAARSSSETAGRRDASTMSFEEAKRAEAVARQQEKLVRQAEETRDAIAELQKAAEAAGTQDPEFQRRLEEIAQQLDRALTPEMRQQLQQLREALGQLDAARSRQALQQLAEAQRQLQQALERSQKLFERAAMEGQMANMAAEARDLAGEQKRWNETVAGADSNRAAAEEKALATRADSLAAAMRAAAAELGKMNEPPASAPMQQSAETAAAASQSMQQAAASAQQGRQPAARQQGQQAEQQLDAMGKQLDQQRKAVQEGWKAEVKAAIDQMMAETSRLADRQLAITEALRAGESTSSFLAEQAAVEEGVARVTEQYKQVAGTNALVPSQIGATLEAAKQQMGAAREALSSAAPGQREASANAGQAIDALNAAAFQMARARGDVSGAGSGSGLAEAMARMNQMAQQQGQLSQEGAQMLPMMGGGAMQEQIRQLAAQQRALAEQMERLRAETQSAGAGELADEARDLSRQMEAGRLDRQTVERQERLYRRMLDAGRTLQGEQPDDQKERKSTTGSQDELRLPPALRAQLEDGSNQLRLPTWEQLQQLSPEDRRLVLDYFRRLTERPSP